jgi:hypothetical protein
MVAVEETGEPGGCVGTEVQLFEHSDAAAVAHLGSDDVLHMDGREVARVDIVETK